MPSVIVNIEQINSKDQDKQSPPSDMGDEETHVRATGISVPFVVLLAMMVT